MSPCWWGLPRLQQPPHNLVMSENSVEEYNTLLIHRSLCHNIWGKVVVATHYWGTLSFIELASNPTSFVTAFYEQLFIAKSAGIFPHTVSLLVLVSKAIIDIFYVWSKAIVSVPIQFAYTYTCLYLQYRHLYWYRYQYRYNTSPECMCITLSCVTLSRVYVCHPVQSVCVSPCPVSPCPECMCVTLSCVTLSRVYVCHPVLCHPVQSVCVSPCPVSPCPECVCVTLSRVYVCHPVQSVCVSPCPLRSTTVTCTLWRPSGTVQLSEMCVTLSPWVYASYSWTLCPWSHLMRRYGTDWVYWYSMSPLLLQCQPIHQSGSPPVSPCMHHLLILNRSL